MKTTTTSPTFGFLQKRPRVRASAVLMRKLYVRERHGVHEEARYLAGASAELNATMHTAEKVDEWVEFAFFVEANERADELFGRGDLMLAWGHRAVRRRAQHRRLEGARHERW